MPETRSLDENDPDAPVEDVEGHEVDDGRRHRRLVDVLKPGKQKHRDVEDPQSTGHLKGPKHDGTVRRLTNLRTGKATEKTVENSTRSGRKVAGSNLGTCKDFFREISAIDSKPSSGFST